MDLGLHDDGVAPAVLDVVDAALERLLAETGGPVVGCVHELAGDLGGADLEEVDGAGGEGEGPDVRAGLAVAWWGQGGGYGLAEEEGAQGLGVLHPVAAADDGGGNAGRFAFLHGFAHAEGTRLAAFAVEGEEAEVTLFDDGEALVPVAFFGFLFRRFQMVLVLEDAFFGPGGASELEAIILEEELLRVDGHVVVFDTVFTGVTLGEGVGETNGLRETLVWTQSAAIRVGGHGGERLAKREFTGGGGEDATAVVK